MIRAMLPRWSDGTLSALKWFGIALMVLDHVDAFAFDRQLLWAGQLGRLVFPIFAVVIGYNLARPGALQAGVYPRVLQRLLVFGVVAMPAHMLLAAQLFGWWPLNIFLTFAAVVGVAWLVELREWVAAAGLFLLAGAVVEYWWPGLALVLAVWQLYRQPSAWALVAVLGSWAALGLVNGSHAALWALPLLLLASGLQLRAPRAKAFFYAFYPLHLGLFAIVLGLGL